MIIYDTISLWLGRVTIAAAAGWLAWSAVVVLCLAIRDSYTSVRNVLDDPKEWWRWFGLPACFLGDLWGQAQARWHGYETHTIRVKPKSQNGKLSQPAGGEGVA